MQHYILSEGVEVYPSGDELVAVHVANDEIHRLNPTAARILGACDGRTRERIASQLRESYPDVPASRIDEDVGQALSMLLAKGLIRVVAGGDGPATP